MKVPSHQISLQAKQAHEADPSAKFILLSLPLDAFDGSAVDVNAASWPVAACRSPLAVRDAMRRHASADNPVILLYPGNDGHVGARCRRDGIGRTQGEDPAQRTLV